MPGPPPPDPTDRARPTPDETPRNPAGDPAGDPAGEKTQWRRWARGLRRPDPHLARNEADRVAGFVAPIEGSVLGYTALGDEVSIDRLIGAGVDVLPRLDESGAMHLHRATGTLDLHHFGIRQPGDDTEAVEPHALAAVLVPARAFDRDGYRLGRGGGHYDRLLLRLAPGTPVVGVTVTDRIVARLPREPHDRPMTHLATETGIHRCPVPAPISTK